MKKKLIITCTIAAAALLLAAALNIFMKPSPAFTWLDFYIGQVDVLKQDGTAEPGKIKKHLDMKDTVITGEKSRAFIQYGADIIFEVAEKSSVLLEQIPLNLRSSGEGTSVILTKGKVSCFVRKLMKNGSFIVKYRTTTIAVRGTLFSVQAVDDSLLVKVLEGSVTVTGSGPAGGTVILQGQKAEISGSTINISAMDKNDESEFHDINAVRPIAGMGCTPAEYVEYYFRWLLGIKDEVPAVDGIDNRDRPSVDETSGPVQDSKTRININQLAANGVEQDEAAGVTMKLYNRLNALKGADSIIYRKVSRKAKSANRQLSGRISRLGNKYIIMVSVVNGLTGKIIYTRTRSIEEAELDKTIDAFALEISGNSEIWEAM